jgi:hypothetical protein
MTIQCTDVRYMTDIQQFNPMDVICIESLEFGYRVWYRE